VSLEALTEIMKDLGIGPDRIVAWLATYDYPLFVATGVRSLLEEFPASLGLVFQDHRPTFDRNQLKEGICAPARLGRLFGFDSAVPIIGMRHHDNHAWFSYLVSPFARGQQPVMIAVVDGSGDLASISLYVAENGTIREIPAFLTRWEYFTASSARRRVAGQLSAARAAIWARRLMAT